MKITLKGISFLSLTDNSRYNELRNWQTREEVCGASTIWSDKELLGLKLYHPFNFCAVSGSGPYG